MQMLVKNLCLVHLLGVVYDFETIFQAPVSWGPKSWSEDAWPFLQDCHMMCVPLEYSDTLATEHLFSMS